MSIQIDVPSDPVSIRIAPSILGRSRLIISTDLPTYRVYHSESGVALAWAGVRRFIRESRILNPSKTSLIRSNCLVIASLCTAWPAFQHPNGLLAAWMPLATVVAIIGTADTCRHLRKRWDWHHAGVLLMIYADLMAVMLLAFMSLSRVYLTSVVP
jgi:hypothetical protein